MIDLNVLRIFFLTLIGLVLGSFAGCFAYRYSSGMSVRFPERSICPDCNATLRWHENIPLVSYLKQLGRCNHCFRPIKVDYFAIEAAMGVAAWVIALRYESLITWACAMAVQSLMITAVAVERRTGVIPLFGWLALPGLLLFMVAGLLPGQTDGSGLTWLGISVLLCIGLSRKPHWLVSIPRFVFPCVGSFGVVLGA